MASKAAVRPEPAPIEACTIARDIQNFDLLIEDMETELGEKWGDLGFEDSLAFLAEPEAGGLKFIALAMDGADEDDLGKVSRVIEAAKSRQIKVILIADDVSPMALHQLMRSGADDFVPYPLPDGALRDVIERQTRAPAAPALVLQPPGIPAHDRNEDRDGAVLAVHGLAGGTGASTLAVNLAWELATIDKKEPPRVCILDLDLQFGSISTFLDLPRREAIFDLYSHIASIDTDALAYAMVVHGEKLPVLTAPADSMPLDFLSPQDVGALLAQARKNYDFVVIDMPKSLVQWTETVLHAAHVYFAMVELEMRSAQNALRFIRTLKAEDLPFEKVRYALNRAPKFTDLSARGRIKRMAESLDIDLDLLLADGGRQVTQANDHGQPLAVFARKNPLRRDIEKLARSLHEINAAKVSAA